MNSFLTEYRVSYSDTDQMGFMHHSNYLRCYETARWEMFRKMDMPYRLVEEEGVILPVVSASLKYIRPAFYDQQLAITTSIKSFRGARIVFENRTVNEAGEIINEAQITVACVNRVTGKACMPPEKIRNAINSMLT